MTEHNHQRTTGNISNHHVNHQLQQETVLIPNNPPATDVPSTSMPLNAKLLAILYGTWSQIGLGIAFAVILTAVIISNIPRREEKSSLSPPVNNQDAEVPVTVSPIASPSSTLNLLSYATNISEVRSLIGHTYIVTGCEL